MKKDSAVIRPSPLTRLMVLPHLWCMYNFAVAISILIWMHATYVQFAFKGRINLGWRLILVGFGKFHIVLLSWCLFLLLTVFLFPCVKFWLFGRHRLRGSVLYDVWCRSWTSSYIIFLLIFILTGINIQSSNELPIASSLVLLSEMIRFVMKMHAFVKWTSSKTTKDSHEPSFANFFYFLFAPTLIYRESFPRTTQRNWYAVSIYLIEIVLCLISISCICETFGVDYFSMIGKPENAIHLSRLIFYVFDSSMMATLVFLHGFYCILHVWLNIVAELTGYAERQSFYQEWWSQSNYKSLFFNLNTLIQDWLQAYIYPDLLDITGRRTASAIISYMPALLYQVVLSLTFSSFVPIFLIIYTLLRLFGTFIDELCGNIFVWTAFFTSNGLVWIFYCLEYYSKANCSYQNNYNFSDSLNVLLPWFLTCNDTVTY